METKRLILSVIKEYSDKLNESWFHGTPDVRELEKSGGFEERTQEVDYISDLEGYNVLRGELDKARETDMDRYYKLLDEVPKVKKTFKYITPVFLTDKQSVARTYADPQRAFDYQNAKQKILVADVDCNRIVRINAHGDQFRFINVDKVKRGFIDAGVSEEKIDTIIKQFNYYIPPEKNGMKTDVVAAIGNYLGFDCIDVIGVLDSYDGGSIKSTVRMVLNPKNVHLKNLN